jgi:hypothetical protein
MPNPVLALQLFSTAVAVKSVIDQKNANKEREADLEEQKRLAERNVFTVLLNNKAYKSKNTTF